MRKTKIVATVGPASRSEDKLRELIATGVDVFRLNMSHGDQAGHQQVIDSIRRMAFEESLSTAILADLQGPKIRLGTFRSGEPVQLQANQRFVLTTYELEGTAEGASISYKALPQEVRPGERILVDDGLIELRVESVTPNEVVTRAVYGGFLKDRKGVNFPDSQLSVPAVTQKDLADIAFAVRNEVDYLALSFVRQAADVAKAREIVSSHNEKHRSLPIIAKIEKPQALEDIERILAVADGIMVARGDLGVEVPAERVPLIQKDLIAAAIKVAKPVITATQMLESMTQTPRPTRAEASDVANAILDGTDAIMLSAETASGRFPVEAVRTMNRIAEYTEASSKSYSRFHDGRDTYGYLPTFAHSVCRAAISAADQLEAKKIIVFTESGATASILSSLRPTPMILAFTPRRDVYHRLSLLRGVIPVMMDHVPDSDTLIRTGDEILIQRQLATRLETVIIVAGVMNVSGATNMMKIHRVDES
ncbi:MAG: pyruvate kinase [Acidobacteria bacterium]|nr:pyruvate kinase [Acidobacteriota bacterium]